MAGKKLHWLDIGEWMALSIATIGFGIAAATGAASWPLLLLAAALIAAALCNGINRRRWQQSSRKRLTSAIKQLQQQFAEEVQASGERHAQETVLPAGDGLNPDGVTPSPAQMPLPQQRPNFNPKSKMAREIPAIDWQCRHCFSGHGAAVSALAIAPDGRWLASASWDRCLKLWELSSGKLLASLVGHSQGLLAIAFLGQEGLATGSFDQSLKLWSLLPAETGEGIEIKLEEILTAHTGSVHSLAAVPDLCLLVSGSYDQTVKQWDWQQGKLVCSSYDPAGAIYAVAVSAAARLVASGGGDGQVALWRLGKGDRLGILTGNISSVHCLAISPDGQSVAAGCVDGSLKLWRTAEPDSPLQSIAAHGGQVKSVAFTAGGQLLVSGGADGQVRFWHPSYHTPLATLELSGAAAAGSVSSLALSAGGEFLAAGGIDGRIEIWQQHALAIS